MLLCCILLYNLYCVLFLVVCVFACAWFCIFISMLGEHFKQEALSFYVNLSFLKITLFKINKKIKKSLDLRVAGLWTNFLEVLLKF